MNKKAILKISIIAIFLIFIVSFFLFFLFSSLTTSLPLEKQKYLVGEKVRVDLSNYEDYKLKIVTPSTSFIKQGSLDIFVYRPSEIGKYEMHLSNRNTNEKFSFEVVNNLDEEISNENISNVESIEPIISNELNEVRNYTYVSNEGDVTRDPIRIGQKVRWIKKIDSSQTESELNRINSFAENVSIYSNRGRISLSSLNELENNVAEIEYYTAEPKSFESELGKNIKEIKISAPDELNYTDVLSFANISELTNNPNNIKIYWKENESYVDFEPYDLDKNGLIDYVEWITPHLSNQTFQIIVITKAEHLDSQKNFINDIYDEVYMLDGNWSEIINDGEYVRVRFEDNLTSENDITIYPRILSGNPIIEIYEYDKDSVIAQFSDITNNNFNKVILNNLNGEQDTFDLKIIGGQIEFDYIVDPTFIAGNEAHDISFAVLNDTTGMFVMAFCNDVSDSASYQVLYTNSSNRTTIQTFDAAAGDSCRIAVSALNSSEFTISYFTWSSTSTDWTVYGFNTNPATLWGPTDIDTDLNANVDIDTSSLNASNYVTAVIDDTDNQVTFSIRNRGTQVVGQTDVVTNSPDTGCLDQSCISVSALNSTLWMLAYFDEDDDNIYYTLRNQIGTQIVAPTVVSASATDASVESATLSNGGFVIAYCDGTDDDVSFRTYSQTGTSISGEIDVNLTVSGCAGAGSTHVGVSSINSSDGQFVIFYDNTLDDRAYFAIYNYSGDEILPNTFVSTTDTAEKTANVRGYNEMKDKELCYYTDEEVFMIGYNNPTNAVWNTYYANGSAWDGDCRDKLPPEIILSSPANITLSNSSIQTFVCNLTDKSTLSNITFYIWNSSGIYNSTTRTLSGRDNSTSLALNLTDNVYNWGCYAEDAFSNGGFSSYNYTLSIDTTRPLINFTSPSESNGSIINRRSIIVNITASDAVSGVKNISIYLFNSSRTMINSSSSNISSFYYNFSVISDGRYYFNATVLDNINLSNYTETRTLVVDTTNPLILFGVGTQVNGFNTTLRNIYLNVSISELNEKNITFNLYNTTSLVNSTTFNITQRTINWTGLIDGRYTYNVTVFDQANNRNNTETRTTVIDNLGPIINIHSPINAEYTSSLILFNFSFSDFLSISRAWFSFNSTNYTYSNYLSMNLNDGAYNLSVYANDSLGNYNYTSINFTVNVLPNITFVNSSGSNIGGNTTILNVINGLYDLKLDITNLNSSIYLNGFNKSGNFSITYSNFTNIDFGYSSFALSFDGMIFTNATLALVANSTHLYKCTDWNMTSLSCNSLYAWDVVMVNEIGSEFNLTLTPEDPGFTQLSIANTDILADGYASEAAAGTEYGARTLMVIANASGTNTRSIISFNLSKVPSGVIIDSANLTVRCSAETLEAAESIGVGVHLVYSDFVWTQGTGGNGGNTCSGTEYCWNNQPTSSQFNSTADSSVIMADGCAGTNYTLNVVNSVKNAYSLNYQNISFNLRPNGSVAGTITGDEVRLTTKEFATAALRPVLNITYHSVPRVIVLNPVSGTNYNYSSFVELRINASDIVVNVSRVFANITLPNGTTLTFNLTNISNQIYQYNYTTPILFGRYNVTFIVNNTDGYFNTTETTWFNVIDGFLPTITYNDPTETNASFYSRTNIAINVSSTDISFANLTIELFNTTSLVNSSVFYTTNGFVNITGLIDGVYYFNATAIDTYGNKNSTQTRSVTVDNTFPLISYGIGTQVNGFNTTLKFIYVNVSVVEASEKNITFSLYNTTSLVNSTTFTNGAREINWTSLIDGVYYYNVTVYDNVENRNSTETRQTTIDSTNPRLIIFEPRNVNYSYNNLTINYTATDIHIDSCFYTIDEGNNNISLPNCANSSFVASEGFGTLIIYVNDSFGNTNRSNVSFFLDSIYPQINFSLPTENNNSEFETDSIYANVSAFDLNELNITFSLYNTTSLVNSTTFSDETREINWTGLDTRNKTYYYNVTLTDILNNRNSTETRQIKLIDVTNPLIILSSPLNKTYYTNMSLSLTYDSTDVNLDSCWYHIDSTANISLPSCLSDSFNVTEGQHTLYLYSNDSLGLLSRQNVTFTANESLLPRRAGILAYSEGAVNPSPMRYRLWDGAAFTGELSAVTPGFLGEWVKVKQSPSRDENILLVANSIDDVTIQINSTLPNGTSCWHNGTTCGKYLNLTTVSTTVNRLKGDVAYETIGEKAIAVVSQANATVLYKIWNGTDWGSNGVVPQTLMTGIISYVKLASHPFRNEIALIMTNTSGLNIMIWNGTDWGCQPATLPANTVSVGVWQHADLTYEQNSGDLFVANTENVATEVRYTTKLDGSCTYNSATTTTMLEQGEIISVTSRYESNYIMISQEDTSGAANSEDMENIVWNGTTIMALSGNDITAFTATSPNIPLGPVWAGTSNFGLAIYSDAATSPNIDYFRYNISTNTWDGAAAGINAVGPTNFTSEESNIKSYSFIERNRSMIIVEDSSSDLWAKYYDADSNTFGNLDGGTAFETTVSSTPMHAFDFEFNNDRSGPSIYIQSPYGYKNSSTVLLNITLGELGTVCTYSVDGNSNISMTSAGSKNFYSSPSLLDGQHNVTFTCFDKWENSRNIQSSFVVDTTLPVVVFNAGTLANSSIVQQNFIFVNVSVTEANFANITYELRNSTSLVNRTTYNISTNNITWYNLIGGIYYYNVSVTDLVGFSNRTDLRNINLTRIRPTVNLIYPVNDSNFSGYFVNNFTFSVSANASIDNCSLYGSWNGGWHLNQTLTNVPQNTIVNFSGVNMSNDGYYIWNVYCYDNISVLGMNSSNFTFSTFLPADYPTIINVSQNSASGNGNITIFWNNASHALRYKIYYSSNMSNFVLLNETSNLNFTDNTFSGNRRRFYYVSSWNSLGENISRDIISSQVFTLSRSSTNTRNWIGFISNISYLVSANDSLNRISNITTFSMWNASIQQRVKCTAFLCPVFPACTPTDCNFRISPGQGYEVHVNSTNPLNYNWSAVGIVNNRVNITLIKNDTNFAKNWISVYANTSMTNAQQLYLNITNADAVSSWNSNLQTSQGLIRNPLPIGAPFLGTNFVLELEKGYEVSVNRSMNFTQY